MDLDALDLLTWLDGHERRAARLESRTHCESGHADFLRVPALAISRIVGSAKRRAQNFQVNASWFRFALKDGKDLMTFLTNERTRVSSSQSCSRRSDPTWGWYVS